MRGVEARRLQCVEVRSSADIEPCRLRTRKGIELFLTLMFSSIVAPAPKHIISEAVLRHRHLDGSACTGMAKARELTTLNGHRQVYSHLWLFPNKGGNIPFESQPVLDMCANL